MLKTNLIGRQFRTEFGKTKYTIVAVHVNSGQLFLVGESAGGDENCAQKGRLIERGVQEVTLIEVPHGSPNWEE